jgi:parallel beta-helix repeat protein
MAGWLRDSSDNTIRLNVLSGNSAGLVIEATASGLAARNVVQGNLIGTDPTGNQARPNWGHGVHILGGSDNLIGGPSLGFDTNIISGNGDTGVLIEARTSSSAPVLPTGNRVVGNFIGPDMSGRGLIPGQTYGVMLRDGSGNTIGGANPGEGNVIAGAGTMFRRAAVPRLRERGAGQPHRHDCGWLGGALRVRRVPYQQRRLHHDSTDNRIIGV